jgi:hypothetical protein
MKFSREKYYVIFYLAMLTSLLPMVATAQSSSKQINAQYQSWWSINNTIRLSKNWGLICDFHLKRNHFLADPGFYFGRWGVNYWLKENITATLGFAQMWVVPSVEGWKQFAQEHRIYQQLQLSSNIGKIGLVHRIRNEQRWQQKMVNDQFIHQYKFTDRVRYLVSANIPFWKNTHYPSLVVSDEIMIQWGKEIVLNTFDQNRIFLGIKQTLGKFLSMDAGYMLIVQQKAAGYQYDKNHTFRCFFYYSPNFSKGHL